MPRTFLQKIGIVSQKEKFLVGAPRSIAIGELKSLVAVAKDRFEEAPAGYYTLNKLGEYSNDRLIDRAIMDDLLGC